MGGDHKTIAWGAGLEDNGDGRKLIVGRVVPATNLPLIPKTLAEAVGISAVKTITATPVNMDLTVAKLRDIKNLAQQHYSHLMSFDRRDQGLAMNMLAEIKFEIEKVIESLESDINK